MHKIPFSEFDGERKTEKSFLVRLYRAIPLPVPIHTVPWESHSREVTLLDGREFGLSDECL